MKPIAIGTLVDYHGSCKHGRYIVTAHHCPHTLPRNEWDEVKDTTPMVSRYGSRRRGQEIGSVNRVYCVRQGKKVSLTAVSCTREGFEPMEPFGERWSKSRPD